MSISTTGWELLRSRYGAVLPIRRLFIWPALPLLAKKEGREIGRERALQLAVLSERLIEFDMALRCPLKAGVSEKFLKTDAIPFVWLTLQKATHYACKFVRHVCCTEVEQADPWRA